MPDVAHRLIADAVVTCGEDGVVVNRPGRIDINAFGRIVGAGPSAEPSVRDAEKTSKVGGLLMPGLVNAHGHGPMTLLRGVGDGLRLDTWLTEAIWQREARLKPGDVYWGMKLASIEMLTAGITSSCEMYFTDHELIEAVEHTGARLMCTPGVVGVVHLDRVHERDGRLAEIRSLHAAYDERADRIRVGVAPHSAYDLPIPIVEELAALARELDAPLHLHLAETEHEGSELESQYAKRTVEVLAERGVLEGHVLAAHGVWLDDVEIELLAEHGTHIAHCPRSNLKLGSGIARIHELRSAGVNVGLGTDSAASNDALDLWQEMSLAALLVRGTLRDPTRVSSDDALLMATRDGAKAAGMADTGTLAPGSWADIIRIDINQVAFTPVHEPHDLVDRLVWAGGSRYVTDVWVAGNHLVSSREMINTDVDETVREVQERGARLGS